MASVELPSLTQEQLDVLRRFVTLDANLDEVRKALAGVFEFDLRPELRLSKGHFRIPEPGVLIKRDDVSRAVENQRLGLMSERDLVYWATMILLNDAFEIDPNDEDFIADWLNDLSNHLDPPIKAGLR